MMNLKKLTAIATTAAAAVIGLTPAAEANVNRHQALFNEIQNLGINLRINPTECMQKPGVMGWYASHRNELVVCQEGGVANGVQVAWTAEDLDTLRHEAHHLVQDCVDKKQNSRLHPVYQAPIELAKTHLSTNTIGWIINDGYANVSDHVKVLELEAFAVAAMNNPAEQVQDIRNYCY